jgi:hypothetical protein
VTRFETSSVSISAAIRFLDELLDPGAFEDYGPNGLQIPGGDTLSKVVTGVSAQRELIERAVRRGPGARAAHRLGELLAGHYDIVHEFVDIPNPVQAPI